MKIKKLQPVLLLIILTILSCDTRLTEQEKIEAFLNKDKVKILVTDSGLGGVSVAANVYERLQSSGVFKEAEVIFFNAQPHLNSGYNSQETTGQKVQIFENALAAMYETFEPDILLIACNTLSVLYHLTEFSKEAEIPVVGVVETGIDLMYRHLRENETSKVIIFATKTTIRQSTHKKGLIEQGIAGGRIINQACPKLAGRIERGAHNENTKALVKQYVDESLQKLNDDTSKLFVSYNCTHYPYIDDVFREQFAERGRPATAYLNPNPLMADFMFKDRLRRRYKASDISIKIVSQPELPPGKIASIYELIVKESPATAEALFDYQFEPEFFEWESIEKGTY